MCHPLFSYKYLRLSRLLAFISEIFENKANNKNLSATGSPTREFTDDIHQIDADSIHVEESDEPSVLDRVGIWIEVQ